jgi:hypothetical protein
MLMKPQWPSIDEVWPIVLAISRLPDGALMMKDKKTARMEWEKMGRAGAVSFEAVIYALNRCRDEYSRPLKKGEFRPMLPYFCRWLKRERWSDYEMPQEPPKANGKVLIRRGSPQARAWEQNRSIPWGPSGVWAVDSEWPPESLI